MDFADQIKILSAKVPDLLSHIKTEAATRNALVEPFIRALGYDTSDPSEVVPEFGADLTVPGVPKDKKIDYGILRNGVPIMLIECKCHTDKLNDGFKQLFHYAVATDCRIGVLTNGIIYRFYADLNKPGKLDDTPFLELDLKNLKEPLLDELRCLTKPSLDIDGMVTAAMELKYVGGILQLLTEQFNSPSEDFVKFFFQRVCDGKSFAGNVKQEFSGYTKRALGQFIRDRINSLMDATGLGVETSVEMPSSTVDDTNKPENGTDKKPQVITTEEELEGFYIVKSILRDSVPPDRIVHRDVSSYFGILLDDNNRKSICRLHFNNPQNKQIGLFDLGKGEKREEKISIKKLDEIYQYSDRLKATVTYYEANADTSSQD